MKYVITFCVVLFFLIACHSATEEKQEDTKIENKNYSRFDGNYNKNFNDLHDLHILAAQQKGVPPLICRSDTSKYMNKLERVPAELELYKTDTLKYSIPYLVNDASSLLIDICSNFRDSLISKKITIYKPIITSVTRTDEDVKVLTKRNRNATEDSAHRYGTTFDISWRRFQKVNTTGEDISTDKLKLVLGQVLHDLRQRDRCYIKHERKQACFHITVR